MALADPPTAVFCADDRMAMGAYDALRNLQLTIPSDVAVVIAAQLRPALTTVALPYYKMGH